MPDGWRHQLVWLSGFWISPLWWLSLVVFPTSLVITCVISAAALALAPVPALLISSRRQKRLRLGAQNAGEQAEQLKLELKTIRYRTAQLREQLAAAHQQARHSRQLALLGQFTAGFLHEFNNPLAIVTSRIEVLLEERQEDAALRADLDQMLKETRYMGNIAGTLLRALRRERGDQTYTPAAPAEALEQASEALGSAAERQRVRIELESPEVPRVDLPAHVVTEVVRGLIANSLEALKERAGGTIWLRLEPYRTPGAKVILRVEDNGPGVPESIREHLFEPFVSQSTGRERLGLGLFLAASLVDNYEGSIRYEPRDGGGACFIIEMPPARFTGGQPYHWFVKGIA